MLSFAARVIQNVDITLADRKCLSEALWGASAESSECSTDKHKHKYKPFEGQSFHSTALIWSSYVLHVSTLETLSQGLDAVFNKK